MKELCEMDCCCRCPKRELCGGCDVCHGHPLGGTCIAANYILQNGFDSYLQMKKKLIEEINSLPIEGLSIQDLYLLSGSYINLKYKMPNHTEITLLEDQNIYLGNQIELNGTPYCFGVAIDDSQIIVSKYQENGLNPELIFYKKR